MTQLFQVVSPGGTQYKIDFDGNTYTVSWLATTKAGAQVWKPIDGPYFGKLANACKALLEAGLVEQDHQAVMTLIWRMDAWAKKIEMAVAATEEQRAQAAATGS